MFTFDSYTAAVKARDEAAALMPAAPPVAEPVKIAKVKALDFIDAILGRFARVSTPAQKDFARFLVCDDWVAGLEITNNGPTFAELAVKLADLEASEVASAPPVEFVAAVVDAIGPVAELGPDGPVDLAAYLASFGDDQADDSTPDDATLDRLARDSEELDTLCGVGGSDRVWDAYPGDWYARVLAEIDEAEAAIKAARVAPCCPVGESTPCMGCTGESFAAELVSAVGPEPLPCPTCGGEGSCPDCDPCPAGSGCRECEAATANLTFLDQVQKPLDDSEPLGMSLAEFVGFQADHFRVFGNAATEMIADHLAALAGRIRRSGMRSVQTYERWDQLDDLDAMEAAERRGFRMGFEEAERREAAFA